MILLYGRYLSDLCLLMWRIAFILLPSSRLMRWLVKHKRQDQHWDHKGFYLAMFRGKWSILVIDFLKFEASSVSRPLLSRFYHPHTCLSYWLFNSLVLAGAIRRKRSKDTLILSAVIAACTLFLVIYWLSKWTCWEYDRQRSSNCAWNKWWGSGIDMHCMVNQYQVGNSVYKKMIIDSLCFLFAYLMKFSFSK